MQEVERRFSVYAPGEDDIAATLRPRSRLPDWLDPDQGAFTVLGRADHGIHLFTRAASHSQRARGRWRQGRLCAGIVPAGDHGCVLTVQVRHRGVVFAYREVLLSLVGAQEEGEPICADFQPRHLLTWTLLGDLSRIVTMRVAEMGTLAGALPRRGRGDGRAGLAAPVAGADVPGRGPRRRPAAPAHPGLAPPRLAPVLRPDRLRRAALRGPDGLAVVADAAPPGAPRPP